jgi:mycothiol synthase
MSMEVSAERRGEVMRLVTAAGEHDGVSPLSEQAILNLRNGRGHSLLRLSGETVVGYGQWQPAEDGSAGELVIHPDHRRQGHGRALLAELHEQATAPLRVWAHGDLPAASALAAQEGLRRVRALFQMRRPLDVPLPPLPPDKNAEIRTFRVGSDEESWLAVNKRAFAHHPEQGAWTLDDVLARENEPWFDPSGFFLAERDGQMVGFHWTKVHPEGVGEVYVVGVDPAAQGLGLGRTLTLAGLHHLRDQGLPEVLLYVDEDNAGAVRLYEKLGFTRYAVDAMYSRR